MRRRNSLLLGLAGLALSAYAVMPSLTNQAKNPKTWRTNSLDAKVSKYVPVFVLKTSSAGIWTGLMFKDTLYELVIWRQNKFGIEYNTHTSIINRKDQYLKFRHKKSTPVRRVFLPFGN
jgi:hypothetical protein